MEDNLFKVENTNTVGTPCFCTGPQNGEPYCPCLMRAKGVYKRGNRWVEPEHDLGEAK